MPGTNQPKKQKPKSKFLLGLLTVFALTLYLRIAHLTTAPSGFHIDEARLAWNSYSLFKTGHDELGKFFPLYHNSIGDYRPTGYFYAAIPSLALLGLNVFAVRLTPVIFGSLSVFLVFLLVYHFRSNKFLAFFSALLLATSPWHISLSRSSSEGVIAITLLLLGCVYLLRYLVRPSRPTFICSIIMFTLSYFFYHSVRLLTPLVIPAIIYLYRTKLSRITRSDVLISLFFVCLTGIFVFTSDGRGRFNQVSIFSTSPHSLNSYASAFIDQFILYFNPQFYLTPGEAKPYRYSTVQHGTTLVTEFGLFALGLILIIQKRLPLFSLPLLLIAILPAALTLEDTPNVHRALLMTPIISIIAGSSLYWLARQSRLLFLAALFLLTVNLFNFWHLYLYDNSTNHIISVSRNAGAVELAKLLPQLQKQYPHILISNKPDPLYPWYAMFNQPEPHTFNTSIHNPLSSSQNWQNIHFTDAMCPSDQLLPNHLTGYLAVDADGCFEPRDTVELVSTIRRPDGTVAYSLWTTPR